MRLGWLVLVLCVASSAWALDVVQVPAKNLLLSWEEPTLNADGSPLTDLDHIVIRGSIDGVAFGEVNVPASGPTGGQVGTHTFMDACAPNTLPLVDVQVYAVDTNHNESEQAPLAYTMDCLPPGKVK